MINVAREMPKYVSHKTVWALKIADIKVYDDGEVVITPADEGYGEFAAPDGWISRVKEGDDKGYYVRYQDGYASWSPTKAFEEGYSPIAVGRGS